MSPLLGSVSRFFDPVLPANEAGGMSNVTYIHPWSLHLSGSDEWEALCGDPEPQMLAEPSEAPKGYYAVCKGCAESSTETSRT